MAIRSTHAPPPPALPLGRRMTLRAYVVLTPVALLVPPHASPTSAPLLIGLRLLLQFALLLRSRLRSQMR